MNTETIVGLVGLAFVAGSLLVGLAVGGAGGYLWVDHQDRVESAESTEGIVVASSVDVRDDPGETRMYSPRVTYEYTVDGETYRRSTLRASPGRQWRSDRGWAERVVADYPAGETVTVHYDPDDPGRAYLRASETPVVAAILLGVGALFLVGAVVSLVGVVAVWVALRRRADG